MDSLDRPRQRLQGGFICMHVRYRAKEGGIYGNRMIGQLRRHGYRISLNTLYLMLRAMEKDGWIEGKDESEGNRRRLHKITSSGQQAKVRIRHGRGFGLPKMAFWSMAHAARRDFCMFLGRAFLLTIGGGRLTLGLMPAQEPVRP